MPRDTVVEKDGVYVKYPISDSNTFTIEVGNAQGHSSWTYRYDCSSGSAVWKYAWSNKDSVCLTSVCGPGCRKKILVEMHDPSAYWELESVLCADTARNLTLCENHEKFFLSNKATGKTQTVVTKYVYHPCEFTTEVTEAAIRYPYVYLAYITCPRPNLVKKPKQYKVKITI